MTKEEILEKLSNYFEYKTSSLLEILDTPSEAAVRRGGYTGVTAGYLMEYVVPGIDENLFVNCINILLDNKTIFRITCNIIDRVVFEKYNSDYKHPRYNKELFSIHELRKSILKKVNIDEEE